MKEKKLIYGVGINDADYPVYQYQKIGDKLEIIQRCPYHQRWRSMLTRCYSKNYQSRNPSYIGCHTVPEWHYFMTFRSWMETQDWQGKQLDKDLLAPNNKIYSPENCVFIDKKVNTFLNECDARRGELPIGVSFHSQVEKYQARCRDIVLNKDKYLGYFDTVEHAYQAWLTFKLEQAKILASQQTDPRVAAALIDRYENYHTYFGGA